MVDALGVLTIWAGMLLIIVGGIFFIITAFREHILWGLGVLFVPLVPLIFLIVEWHTAKRPFFWQLWGIVLIVLGLFALSAELPFVHYHYHHHA
jgi:hypothetical protein